MKIIHCCLAAFYIDNYGYQENTLPKIHKLQGHEVEIVASTETYIENRFLGYVNPGSYINENGIKVTRLRYASWLPHRIMRKIRAYQGLYDVLEVFKPDIIFLHDVQFLDARVVVNFVTHNPHVKIYADGHTDFINSARNWLSKNVLHKIIYRYCAKVLEPYTEKFFGVTPLRVNFFRDVYGIKESKLDLLVMGIDDSVINIADKKAIRSEVRSKLGFSEDDIIIISGGKIDKRKNIHVLLKAFDNINKAFTNRNIKLVLFGATSEEMAYLIDVMLASENVLYLGWLKPDEVYQYLLASDIACFPGTHSVLWEQAVGLGIPSVFRKWEGMQHVDVGGNCLFLEGDTHTELYDQILKLVNDPEFYTELKNVAETKGVERFSYYKIASKAIGY